MTAAPPFVGVVECCGFVVDTPVIGEAEARRRVVERWRDGDRLSLLPDGRWLLLLSQIELSRCETAIGLPLVRGEAGGIIPAGALRTPAAGAVELRVGGAWGGAELAALPVLDPAAWVSVPPGDAIVLAPIEPAQAVSPVADQTTADAVDLRGKSRIGAPDAAAVDALARLRAAGSGQQGPPGGTRFVPPTPRPRWWDAMVNRVLDSPLSRVFASGQRRYLERLGRAFESKDFDEALRNAIGLGGNDLGRTTMRLPSPRDSYARPSMAPSHGGSVTRFPTSVHAYLRELYRNAATALEQEGRIEEAAFVHADLLDEVGAALSLLERHGRIALAADLADARSDDAVAAVRLLWKAGRHQRALDVARARGAFAAAIVRLDDKGDGDAARELRSAWADALRDSGDYLGAVEVLWADTGLREAAAADIEVGLVLGGAVRTHLLPYALANGPRPDLAEEAIALARGGDPENPHQTIEFVRSLSEHQAHDRALDRRLSSEVLRVLVDADRSPVRDHALARRYSGKLSGRADPVLRADLSKVTPRLSAAPVPTLVAMTAQAGTLPIRDVAPLDSGDLLVASGSLGLRLFSPQGRLRARWDVPSERLSVVDHGGGVVVAASAGNGTWSTHRLDLATRRIRPWVTVRAQRLLDSFDGLTLGMVEEEGTLGFLDASSDRARIVWRELRDVGRAVDVARSGKEMAAVVALSDPPPGHTGLEMWWWSLPGMTLRGRRAIPWPEGQAGITADGTFWQLEQAVSQDDPSRSGWSLSWMAAYEGLRQRPLPPGQLTLLTTGTAHVLLRRPGSADEGDLSVELRTGPWDHPDLTVEIAGCLGAEVRLGRGLACVWDPEGRVLVADLTDRHVLCNLALGV